MNTRASLVALLILIFFMGFLKHVDRVYHQDKPIEKIESGRGL